MRITAAKGRERQATWTVYSTLSRNSCIMLENELFRGPLFSQVPQKRILLLKYIEGLSLVGLLLSTLFSILVLTTPLPFPLYR